MTIHLMNSAMMPTEGIYHCKRIDKNIFVNMINDNDTKSSIGYQSTIDAMYNMGVKKNIQLSRELTTLLDGDIALVIKLKYRVGNPNDKKHLEPSEDDFEFFEINYKCE